MLAVMMTRWIPLMTAVVCALAFGLALLRDIGQRGAIRPRHVDADDPRGRRGRRDGRPDRGLSGDGRSGRASPGGANVHRRQRRLADGTDADVYPQHGQGVRVRSTMTLSAVYFFKIARTSDALATAQLGLSEAQTPRPRRGASQRASRGGPGVPVRHPGRGRSALRQRAASRGASARRTDPVSARRVAVDRRNHRDAGTASSTWCAPIWTSRRSGRPDGCEERSTCRASSNPGPSRRRWSCRWWHSPRGATPTPSRDANVDVRASVQGGWLVIEVQGDGSQSALSVEQESTLASLRQRVSVLYGSEAELSFVPREPRGSSAKIVIADPGNL